MPTDSGVHEGPERASEPIVLRELRESPRRPGRYLLALSDGRQFVVSAGVLGETGATRAGLTLEAAVVKRLQHESIVTDLADRALDALARGRRTRLELERRLRRASRGKTGEAAGSQ